MLSWGLLHAILPGGVARPAWVPPGAANHPQHLLAGWYPAGGNALAMAGHMPHGHMPPGPAICERGTGCTTAGKSLAKGGPASHTTTAPPSQGGSSRGGHPPP